jgi:hypothetical protein
MSRTPAGRKDGGIKLLDINEQPLGYAQAKKRKRMQGHCSHAFKRCQFVQVPLKVLCFRTRIVSRTSQYYIFEDKLVFLFEQKGGEFGTNI